MKTTTEMRFRWVAENFCDNYCRRPREIKNEEDLRELCAQDCPLDNMRKLLEEIEHGAEKEPAAGTAAGDGADGA